MLVGQSGKLFSILERPSSGRVTRTKIGTAIRIAGIDVVFQKIVSPMMADEGRVTPRVDPMNRYTSTAATRFPKETKITVAATKDGQDLYLWTNQPKNRNARKFAGTPAIRLRVGFVWTKKSPTNVPRPAPIATGTYSATTAMYAGRNTPTKSCPTPQGVGMNAVIHFPMAYRTVEMTITATLEEVVELRDK